MRRECNPSAVPVRQLYGEIDHIYGWKAFEARNGFTAAQGALNALETLMYLSYLWTYCFSSSVATSKGGAKALSGRPAARAVLVAFSAAVMTLSKTVLYCEFFFFFCFPVSLENWVLPPFHVGI